MDNGNKLYVYYIWFDIWQFQKLQKTGGYDILNVML
jgi:hypothetical protein